MVKEDNDKSKKERALKISIKEGVSTTLAGDLGNSLIVPLATEIGSSAFQIGILNAFASLFSPLAQIRGERLIEKHDRKKIVTKYVFWHALSWLPIAAIGILYWKNILTGFMPWLLILIYTMLSIFFNMPYPAWFSWMGDLVKEKERGKYFAKRNFYMGIASSIVLVLGGWFLKYAKSTGNVFFGFSILFIFSFIFSLLALFFYKKQYSPKFKLTRKSYFTFKDFIKRYDNYGKFAVYQAFFNFSIMLASPFFSYYMLTKLGLNQNYLSYMIIILAVTFFYVIFTPLAGKFSDKYGNLKLMWVANIAFVLSPLLWIIVKSPIEILLLPQLAAGIGNAALAIAVTNYTYDSVSKKHRPLCIAYTNMLIGIGTFVGSLIGGLLITYVHLSIINSFFFVFLLAAVLRLIVALIFLPKIKEVKKVSEIPIHIPSYSKISNFVNPFNIEKNIAGLFHSKEGKEGKERI